MAKHLFEENTNHFNAKLFLNVPRNGSPKFHFKNWSHVNFHLRWPVCSAFCRRIRRNVRPICRMVRWPSHKCPVRWVLRRTLDCCDTPTICPISSGTASRTLKLISWVAVRWPVSHRSIRWWIKVALVNPKLFDHQPRVWANRRFQPFECEKWVGGVQMVRVIACGRFLSAVCPT